MALVVWQTPAKRHLKALFDYYREHASDKVACSLRDTLVKSVDQLENFPKSGTIDTELSTPETQYYFLIAKWGKRRYRIYYLYENDTCPILAIWDCSMNPRKRRSRVVPK